MGNENSDAQNNQKCGNNFKHRTGPAQSTYWRVDFLHSQRDSAKTWNFLPLDDLEQHDVEIGLKAENGRANSAACSSFGSNQTKEDAGELAAMIHHDLSQIEGCP
jgi:hypothetical protein